MPARATACISFLVLSILYGCFPDPSKVVATPANCQELENWPSAYVGRGVYVCDDRGVRCYMDGHGLSCITLKEIINDH